MDEWKSRASRNEYFNGMNSFERFTFIGIDIIIPIFTNEKMESQGS